MSAAAPLAASPPSVTPPAHLVDLVVRSSQRFDSLRAELDEIDRTYMQTTIDGRWNMRGMKRESNTAREEISACSLQCLITPSAPRCWQL